MRRTRTASEVEAASVRVSELSTKRSKTSTNITRQGSRKKQARASREDGGMSLLHVVKYVFATLVRLLLYMLLLIISFYNSYPKPGWLSSLTALTWLLL